MGVTVSTGEDKVLQEGYRRSHGDRDNDRLCSELTLEERAGVREEGAGETAGAGGKLYVGNGGKRPRRSGVHT